MIIIFRKETTSWCLCCTLIIVEISTDWLHVNYAQDFRKMKAFLAKCGHSF